MFRTKETIENDECEIKELSEDQKFSSSPSVHKKKKMKIQSDFALESLQIRFLLLLLFRGNI